MATNGLFSNISLPLVLSILAIILACFSLVKNYRSAKFRKAFYGDKENPDLESSLLGLVKQIQQHGRQLEELQQEIVLNRSVLGFAVQKVGLVRFNPFAGSGGNLSFSLAMLDEHNNGVVITSMYGREQNRIYAKSVKGGKSDSQLTEEEMQAVMASQKNHN